MKIPDRELTRNNLPYLLLCILLALCALILFISSLTFKNKADRLEPASPYVQGYNLKSRLYGAVRLIPIAGASFTSPVSNSANAALSPYQENEEEGKGLENSITY